VNETQDPGYTYDANGNLTSDGVKDYFWDAANRLIAMQTRTTPPSGLTNFIGPLPTPPPPITPSPNFDPPSPKPPTTPPPVNNISAPRALARSEFSYDGLGRRARVIEKQSNTVDANGNPVWTTVSDHPYVWDGNTLAEERDGSGTTVTKRFYAEGEQINGVSYFYTRDHLGSVRELIDSAGTVHAQYEYDPYGNRTKLSGDLDSDFGFTGHWHHGPSGLNLSLYRAYSPTLGRWISRDPIGESGGLNLYGYVENDPSNAIDPLGLCPAPCREGEIRTVTHVEPRLTFKLNATYSRTWATWILFRKPPIPIPTVINWYDCTQTFVCRSGEMVPISEKQCTMRPGGWL
jgi:RHS repeat-associated protein